MAFTFYKQPDAMDCGPACLRMVAKYYGRDITLQALREKTQIGKDGVNLLGIAEAAESIGFRTKSMKLSYDVLIDNVKLPAILHWRQNHFVVLYKATKKKLYIADPAAGLITLNPAEFKSQWTIGEEQVGEGISLVLEPSPLFYNRKDEQSYSKKKFKSIFKYALPYKKLVLQLLAGLALTSLFQLVLPFLTRSVVDTGVNSGDINFIFVVLLAQLALFAGRMVVEFIRGWILLHISTRINISILTDFLIKLMRLPVAYFDSKHTGDIMQRMNDHSRIESFLTGSSLSIVFSMVNLLIFSVVLILFNTTIFVVFAATSILYAAWILLFLKKRKLLDYKRFSIASREQSSTIQLVQGMQEIKINGAEKYMRWSWESLQVKLFRLRVKNLSLNQWQQAGSFLINEGKNIFITFLSAKAVIDGQMTLGSMLAVQYIIGQLNSPIEQLISFVQSLQGAKISFDRLNEIHAMEDEEPAGKLFQYQLPDSFTSQLRGGRSEVNFLNQASNIDDCCFTRNEKSGIYFDDVSFTYPGAGNQPVLKNITLQIPRGKTTAIVGISGSGKTTLLKLLLRFYSPQQGRIDIGETALDDISHKVWRSHCGAVMQESFIFSDTIAGNIAVGVESIDKKRLEEAAQLANVSEFIESLPLQYDTKIGAEATGISMGQKQRILIARAVYRNPEFIFFDEATNSLDANNESIILQNLESFFRNRTVVVVAHRLSTVKNADQIILLHKGRIAESGTHAELVNLKGGYHALVKNQLDLGS